MGKNFINYKRYENLIYDVIFATDPFAADRKILCAGATCLMLLMSHAWESP